MIKLYIRKPTTAEFAAAWLRAHDGRNQPANAHRCIEAQRQRQAGIATDDRDRDAKSQVPRMYVLVSNIVSRLIV